MRPTDISRKLVVSRVTVSRTISAIGKENPVEILTGIPGPESLRSIIQAAQKNGVENGDVKVALVAVECFEALIRDQFGTRAALNAALSVKHSGSRDQFEQSSRYKVFKGMSQIIGAESKLWLTCTMYTPNKDDPSTFDLSSIFGPSGLRRIRPDTPIELTFSAGPQRWSVEGEPSGMTFDLESFCANTLAPITVAQKDGKVIKTFAPDIGNKDSIYDMLTGVHIPNAMSRIARPSLTRRGISVIPVIPVALLNMDIILHRSIFEGIEPEAFVYNNRGSGKADFENPDWNINRMATDDKIMQINPGLNNLDLQEVPRYRDMVLRMCDVNGYEPAGFRAYRLQIQYPVYGFQYVMAFRVPSR